MRARFLPVGSYLQLHQMLNLPGPGSSKKWTCNGKPNATTHCVQYMVRDDRGYWLHVPAGHHKGWYHVPFDAVQYCRAEPSMEVLQATLEADNAVQAASATTGADTQPQTSDKPAAA